MSAEIQRLADELFAAVEGPQGNAFVSDGEVANSPGAFFDMVRGRLAWNNKASQVMRDFLNKHGEPTPELQGADEALGRVRDAHSNPIDKVVLIRTADRDTLLASHAALTADVERLTVLLGMHAHRADTADVEVRTLRNAGVDLLDRAEKAEAENEQLRQQRDHWKGLTVNRPAETQAVLDSLAKDRIEVEAAIMELTVDLDKKVSSLSLHHAFDSLRRASDAIYTSNGVIAQAKVENEQLRRALETVLAKAEKAYEDGELEQGALFAIREWVAATPPRDTAAGEVSMPWQPPKK